MSSPQSGGILDGLNKAQLEAVTAQERTVLVLAGPGSGKTRVLTRRIAWLIAECGLPPWRIMAVTFTNKAAHEMRARVEHMLGEGVKGLSMGTFHATCARVLRREANLLPISSDYVIYDSADQHTLIRSVIVEDLKLDEKRYQPARILDRISRLKNHLVAAEDFVPESYLEEMAKRAYEHYQARLLSNDAVDFDDLLMHTARLFEQHPDVLARYRNTYDHVLVDEFQDTNFAQYRLVQLLTGEQGNLFCVGDEDQSIYRWRGADYRNVLRLREDFPKLRTILLEQNYRSTQLILDAARAVIDKNPYRTPKNLFTEQEGGPKITLYEAHNEQYEAQFVVESIASLVASGEVEPGGCAVMYRINAQSRVLEDAFMREGLPYRLVGATRFYGRKEIKDVIAYLRIIHNPEDTLSLLRVINTPTRGVGTKTIEALQTWAEAEGLTLYGALERLSQAPHDGPLASRARNAVVAFVNLLQGWRAVKDDQPLVELMKLLLDETNYLTSLEDGTSQGGERIANVTELLNLAAEFEDLPLSTFLEEVALVSDVDTLKEEVNAPSLMTLHAAKGLEFDAIFIVGTEEGILPHNRSLEDPEQMAEERRLMYVGMTRARKHLCIVYAFRRTVWGETSLGEPSRFIWDIPSGLLASSATGGVADYRLATTWSSGPPRILGSNADVEAIPCYTAGQRVFHPKFGAGIVVQSRQTGNDEEVSVVFDEVGLKRLLASFANLEALEE